MTYFALVDYTSNGTTKIYTIPFSYIQESDVKVYLNGTLQESTAYTFPTVSSIEFNVQPPAGHLIRIQRQTETNTKLVDFQSAAVITEADLDLNSTQLLYIMQEIMDIGINSWITDEAVQTVLGTEVLCGDHETACGNYVTACGNYVTSCGTHETNCIEQADYVTDLIDEAKLLIDTKLITLLGVRNLKLARNTAVNKLDIFAQSSGAAPNVDNQIHIPITDGNSITMRQRGAAYLSGTSQIVLADGVGYWGFASGDGTAHRAYLYAIWDGTGIVWGISGDMSLRKVTTTTTQTDSDYILLEDGSTYTRNAAHYCQLVGAITVEYDTGDTPDYTLAASFNVYAIDPLFDELKNSKAANGYQKLPSGLILQWGLVANASHSLEYDFGTITFPITFPTACLNVTATLTTDETVGDTDNWGVVKSFSAASCNLFSCAATVGTKTFGIIWFAIGY